MLTFLQVPLKYDIYMRLPVGFDFKHGNSKTHVLKLRKHLYELKQASKFWFDHLSKGSKDIAFIRSEVDESVSMRGTTIFMCHIDDEIFVDP